MYILKWSKTGTSPSPWPRTRVSLSEDSVWPQAGLGAWELFQELYNQHRVGVGRKIPQLLPSVEQLGDIFNLFIIRPCLCPFPTPSLCLLDFQVMTSLSSSESAFGGI